LSQLNTLSTFSINRIALPSIGKYFPTFRSKRHNAPSILCSYLRLVAADFALNFTAVLASNFAMGRIP
jgi:hypothetical protein